MTTRRTAESSLCEKARLPSANARCRLPLPEVAVKPRPLGPGYKATVLAFSVIDFAASQDLGLDEPNVKPVEMRRSKAESVKQEPAEAIPQKPAERRRNPLHLMERRMSNLRRLRELVTIVTRRGAQKADEGAAHQIYTAESVGGSDLFEAAVGSLELTAGAFDAHLQYVL